MATNRLLCLLVFLLPLGARAQTEPDAPLHWVRLPAYQLQYHGPANWTPVRQATDSSLPIIPHSPALVFTTGMD